MIGAVGTPWPRRGADVRFVAITAVAPGYVDAEPVAVDLSLG